MNPSAAARQSRVLTRLDTEFGRVLRTVVDGVPGAWGAVLCDELGDAIDFAHDPAAISELDLQIVGAQIGQEMLRMELTATSHGIGTPTVLLEARLRTLVATVVSAEYVTALVLGPTANVARGLIEIDHGRTALSALLS